MMGNQLTVLDLLSVRLGLTRTRFNQLKVSNGAVLTNRFVHLILRRKPSK